MSAVQDAERKGRRRSKMVACCYDAVSGSALFLAMFPGSEINVEDGVFLERDRHTGDKVSRLTLLVKIRDS